MLAPASTLTRVVMMAIQISADGRTPSEPLPAQAAPGWDVWAYAEKLYTDYLAYTSPPSLRRGGRPLGTS